MIQESALFDVTIGAYNGGQVCELAGSFLLYQISNKDDKKDIAFRNHLSVFRNEIGLQAQRIKKDFPISITASK